MPSSGGGAPIDTKNALEEAVMARARPLRPLLWRAC